ncbi:MAG: hypothetical protein WD824_10320 [Cyclobacteriaceae bacterium]
MKSAGFITLIIILVFCDGQHTNYKPENLQKVSDETRISWAAKRSPIDLENAIIKDTLGNPVSKEDVQNIDHNIFFGDLYADRNGNIVEIVKRKQTEADRDLLKKI